MSGRTPGKGPTDYPSENGRQRQISFQKPDGRVKGVQRDWRKFPATRNPATRNRGKASSSLWNTWRLLICYYSGSFPWIYLSFWIDFRLPIRLFWTFCWVPLDATVEPNQPQEVTMDIVSIVNVGKKGNGNATVLRTSPERDRRTHERSPNDSSTKEKVPDTLANVLVVLLGTRYW